MWLFRCHPLCGPETGSTSSAIQSSPKSQAFRIRFDLAVLVVHAEATPPPSAHARHGASVPASSYRRAFAKQVPKGPPWKRRCLSLPRAHGMRLLGPNCIGVIDTHLPLDTSFLQPPMPPEGGVALITQSGAFGAAIVDWARGAGFGFSQIVSLGNQVRRKRNRHASRGPGGRSDACHYPIPGGRCGRGAICSTPPESVARHRAVLALKVGRSASGRRAAASHTAALAGSDIGFDAALLKCGVFRANSSEQLFDWARALEACPLPRGRGVAVLTDAGGPGVIAADASGDKRLDVVRTRSGHSGLFSPRNCPLRRAFSIRSIC